MNRILVVYNTCGIKSNNTNWYIKCLSSLLEQDFNDYKIVLSSCLNSNECVEGIKNIFGSKIEYCLHNEAHTVNITFNKAVRDCVKKYGEFDSYLYVDSGCSFEHTPDLISKLYESFVREEDTKNGIVYAQVDTDEALQVLGNRFKYQSSEIQIRDNDLTIPIGVGINLHVALFANNIYKRYKRILPDVFAAYCSESTFTFLAASVGLKNIILADRQVTHMKAVDGASLCVPHHSPVHRNPWNNLLCSRNALEFINDQSAINSGLGYEECNQIMMHNPDAYEVSGKPKYPESLQQNIEKYFFLSETELNYDQMQSTFIN